jgi:diguanylate cyclase (GGDEF)-like protein
MRFKLQSRYAALIFAALVLALATLVLLMYRQGNSLAGEMTELGASSLENAAKNQQRQRAALLSEFLAPTLLTPVYYGNFDQVRDLLNNALRQPDVVYAVVFDAQGKLLHDGSLLVDRFGGAMSDAGATTAVQATTRITQDFGNTLEVVTPLYIGTERIGGLRLGLSLQSGMELAKQNRESLERASKSSLSERMLRVVPWLIGVALLCALLSLVVSRGLLNPILKLQDHAKRLEQGDYAVRTESHRRDEIGELMRSFDTMAASVARQHQEIAHLAFADTLTNLPNRNRMKAMLTAMLEADPEHRKPLTLLLLDLDDFKRINDSLGHDTGDQLILQLAERLQGMIEEEIRGFSQRTDLQPNITLGRFGGDEFLIVVQSSAPREHAGSLSQRILAGLEAPFALGDKQIYVSASIGLSVFPDDGASVELLLKNADVAMYQAKLSGKNGAKFFAQTMVEEVSHRLNLEGELRQAIERGELHLQYQPLVNLSDRRMIGCEALMRWRHPQFGDVPPAVFIPLAEDTDLIGVLGEWALQEACRQIQAWLPLLPADFYVTVNVSVRQIRRQDIAQIIQRAIVQTPIPIKHLNLEITESSLFESSAQSRAVMDRLLQFGLRLWLDDFGTGFSGLSQLRRLSVHGVKIDKSFISDMADDHEDLAITHAIIAMAHSLGMKVTAEGIETETQLKLLQDRGCDTGQGYLFAQPLHPNGIVEMLDKAIA